MRVAEIYKSLQGEGALTGTPSVFVRTSGCNLRCDFCDTPFTSWEPEGDDLAVDEIVEAINTHEAFHVVLTGGEPMLYAELAPLTAVLAAEGRHITIETAGTLYLNVDCDLMSISPKLSNSTPPLQRTARWHHRHERARHAPKVIRRLVDEYPYQFKFVVANAADCDEVETYLAEFPAIDRARVWLMPEGTDPGRLQTAGKWLEPEAERRGFKFCPRRHIEWYGFTRGT